MISQEDLKVISAVFGKPVDEISGALTKSEEVSLGLRLNGKILSEDEQKTLKETAVKQGKEIGYKEIAKNLDITLDAGEKDASIIAEKLKTTLSTVFEEKYKSQTPTDEVIALAKKATEFEDKYKKLFDTHKQKETEVEQWKTKFFETEKEIKEKELNNKILSVLPKDITMDQSDALLIIRNSLAFEDAEGTLHIKRGGKLETDPIGNPETIDNVIKSFVESKGWLKKSGGMGGGDRTDGHGHGKNNMTQDQVYKYLKEKGIAPASPEGIKFWRENVIK